MDIKEKLQQILIQAEQRLESHPNILGLPDHAKIYGYLVGKIESIIDFMDYEDELKEIIKSDKK